MTLRSRDPSEWAACALALLLLSTPCLATDLALVVGPAPEAAASASDADLTVEVSWRNAWRDADGGDGVWFVLRDGGRALDGPLRLASLAIVEATLDGEATTARAEVVDAIAGHVRLAEPGRGDARLVLAVTLGDEPPSDVRAHGLEMVEVPPGPYALGDLDPDVLGLGAFRQVGHDPGVRPYDVLDEGAIEVGDRPGALAYDVGEVPQYRGDRGGPIPAAFPKGTGGFLLQKYELLQGQYAAFLDALPEAARSARMFVPDPDEPAHAAWSIGVVDGRVQAAAPSRPCPFVSWDDSCAYLDWMALRPMTELEYEKAARGQRPVMARGYPWGGDDPAGVRRRVGPLRDLAHADADQERALAAGPALASGVAACGAYDLSGSLWERVVSVGHPVGRRFTAVHGDGRLDADARADVPGWPRGDADGRAADGIGYRGGAEYFAEPGLTNPYSPIGARTYAAWNGAYRAPTYSARGVRSWPAAR